MRLKNKLINGGLWNGVAQFGSQGFTFVLMLVLARFLSPKDFGLLGMVSVITGFFGYFSECGLIASLIKKKNIDQLDCNTVFWSGLILGLLVYLLIYALAPFIAQFYAQPELTNLARLLAWVFIIRSYSFVPFALEQKKLHYHKLSIIKLVSLVISGGMAIFFVMRGIGVWTLVWQQIIMEVVLFFGTFFWIKWKPKGQFSFLRFKALFSFGIHVTANNLIKFFSENIDYLLVGKLLGSEALGIYSMAFRLSKYPIEKIGAILGNMLLPAFALIQDKPDEIKKNMLRVSACIACITIPFIIFLFFTTDSFVRLIVGEKWLATVPLIKLFVIYIFFLSFSFADESILMIGGKIKQLNFIKLVTALSLLFIGYWMVLNWGIMGMAIIYTTLFSIYSICLKITTLKLVNIRVITYFRCMQKTYVYSVILFSIAFLSQLLAIEKDLFQLLSMSLGLLLTLLIINVTYLKIITFNPVKINIDKSLNLTKL
jgi:PST family polysaccharide transporter